MIRIAFLLLAIALFTATGRSAVAEELRAGVAVCDITPPIGCVMWGYGDRDGVADFQLGICVVAHELDAGLSGREELGDTLADGIGQRLGVDPLRWDVVEDLCHPAPPDAVSPPS